MCAFLLAVAIFELIYELATGIWDPRESLPLHLCDLAHFAAIAATAAASKSPQPPPTGADNLTHSSASRVRGFTQFMFELTYYWGLAGTLQALITPALAEGFPHPLYFEFFASHGGIIIVGIVMTAGLGWRPSPGSPWRVLALTYLLAAPIGLANWLLGANYMYLCGPPPRGSLYDYFGPWPFSLVTLATLGIVLMWCCYLPWRLALRRR